MPLSSRLGGLQNLSAADLAKTIFGDLGNINPTLKTLLFCCWSFLGEEPATLSGLSMRLFAFIFVPALQPSLGHSCGLLSRMVAMRSVLGVEQRSLWYVAWRASLP